MTVLGTPAWRQIGIGPANVRLLGGAPIMVHQRPGPGQYPVLNSKGEPVLNSDGTPVLSSSSGNTYPRLQHSQILMCGQEITLLADAPVWAAVVWLNRRARLQVTALYPVLNSGGIPVLNSDGNPVFRAP